MLKRDTQAAHTELFSGNKHTSSAWLIIQVNGCMAICSSTLHTLLSPHSFHLTESKSSHSVHYWQVGKYSKHLDVSLVLSFYCPVFFKYKGIFFLLNIHGHSYIHSTTHIFCCYHQTQGLAHGRQMLYNYAIKSGLFLLFLKKIKKKITIFPMCISNS